MKDDELKSFRITGPPFPAETVIGTAGWTGEPETLSLRAERETFRDEIGYGGIEHATLASKRRDDMNRRHRDELAGFDQNVRSAVSNARGYASKYLSQARKLSLWSLGGVIGAAAAWLGIPALVPDLQLAGYILGILATFAGVATAVFAGLIGDAARNQRDRVAGLEAGTIDPY